MSRTVGDEDRDEARASAPAPPPKRCNHNVDFKHCSCGLAEYQCEDCTVSCYEWALLQKEARERAADEQLAQHKAARSLR